MPRPIVFIALLLAVSAAQAQQGPPDPCCWGRVGDVNGLGGDEPTIGDPSLLTYFMFMSGDPNVIPCLTEADVNQSGGTDPQPWIDLTIGDVMILIDYLFITGPTVGLSDCLVSDEAPLDSCRPCGTDLGDPDSVYFQVTMPEPGGNDSLVVADLYVFNDVQNVTNMSMGFSWDHPYLEMDSAVWSAESQAAFNMWRLGYYRDIDIIDSTNVNQLFQCVGMRFTGDGLVASGQAKAVVSYFFHLNDFTGSDSVCIYLEDFNEPYFVDENNEEYIPQWLAMCDRVICCVDRVGDANGVGGDEPTIGDVSTMIDALFISSTCDGILECLAEADINQSGGLHPHSSDITIGDISTLIDYLFITGPSLGLAECM